MPKIGIIAGSGFYQIEGVEVKEIREVITPYGEPSDDYKICEFSGREFVFLARHGSSHRFPPHSINYRANLWGLKELGVERILAVNAVGGINPNLCPGDIMIPDQIIDQTFGRAATFYDEGEVVHVDFTNPYCNSMRNTLFDSGGRCNILTKESGVHVCVNGPRLETSAEIRFLSGIGGDVVGMTGMPEACLARELELCFACIAVVTNYAAGISAKKLTTTEVIETMKVSMERIKNLLIETLKSVPEIRTCNCKDALKGARI